VSHLWLCGSTSRAAVLDRFPLVARTQVHRDSQQLRQFCSFLGLLAPVHAQDAQIIFSEEQVKGCFLQHFCSWNSTTISSSCYRNNCNALIRTMKEDCPQNNSWALQIISIISIPWPQLKWILSNHSFWPDYQAQQSLSCHFPHFTCVPSYEDYIAQDTFFCWMITKARILCKIISHSVTKGRKNVCTSCLLHFNSSDLKSKHPRLSAEGFFPPVSLFSSIRIKKKKFSHSLSGKAYAVMNAIISCPENVTQFLILSKSQENSFGTNSRLGLWLGSLENNSWPFVLDTF
jgi:hypothetical protein